MLKKMVGCGCLTLTAAVVSFCILFFVSLLCFGNLDDSSYFAPMVWSPNGAHLVFGLSINESYSHQLFVIDADGRHLREIINLENEKNIDPFIYTVWWDANSSRIYFNTRDLGKNIDTYVIPLDNGALYRVPYTAAPVEEPETEPIRCGYTRFVTQGSINQHRLAAQNVCINNPYGCDNYILQICDLTTDSVIFEVDKEDMTQHTTAEYITHRLLFISLILGIASGVVVLLSILIGGIRLVVRKRRSEA